MKRTPFYDKHVALGAKMVEFGGYEMPVQYPTGIIAEHKIVREGGVGVFDVSHMGEFDISGPDALPFLQYLTVNDVSALSAGKAQYNAMTLENGGIIDDLIIYMLEYDHYMAVVNAGTQPADWQHFLKIAENYNVRLRNDSDATSLLAIQGAKSLETMQKLTDVTLSGIPYYNFAKGTIAGIETLISRTGYTGETGIEIYFSSEHGVATHVWDAILDAGKEFSIAPIGLGARDTLRLEMGYCLYGNDIDERTNPLEAGLGWITKLNKSTPCLAVNALKSEKEKGISRKLSGFIIEEKGAIARHGHSIYDPVGNKIGEVTSGNISPILGKAIGLGYVPVGESKEGTEIFIETRAGKKVSAKIVKPPFVQPHTK